MEGFDPTSSSLGRPTFNDYAERNDRERKSSPPVPPRAASEAGIRALIREEFRVTAGYAPRCFADMAEHVVRDLRRCRAEHTASIRRERVMARWTTDRARIAAELDAPLPHRR